MTQQSLANAVGVHVWMIRRYETDAAQPSTDVLTKLAVALSAPADVFLFDDKRGPGEELRLQLDEPLQHVDQRTATFLLRPDTVHDRGCQQPDHVHPFKSLGGRNAPRLQS